MSNFVDGEVFAELMSLPNSKILTAVWAVLVVAIPAFASPQFSINAPQRIRVGETLKVNIAVDSALDSLKATVVDTVSDKTVFTQKWHRVKPSSPTTVAIKLTPGRHQMTLNLDAAYGESTSSIRFPLNVFVVSPLVVKVGKSGLDPQSGRLSLIAGSSIAGVEIEVFDRHGSPMFQKTHDFKAAPRKGLFEVDFEPIGAETIFRLELKVSDEAGQWRRFKFVKWFAEIPHEDVVFESGKWAISPLEAKKLEKDIKLLNREVKAFRNTVGRADVAFDVTLYIAGMTDTVGRKLDNQRLSLRRAQAIGQYFRRRGFSMPIKIAGFGESGLRVATPDETAEAKNRRAVYILTSGTAPNLAPPSGRWQKL